MDMSPKQDSEFKDNVDGSEPENLTATVQETDEAREADTYGGKPTTLKGKLENFWYHYKWHTIVSVVVVAIIGVLISQAVTAPKYDINIIYAGEYSFSRTGSNGDTAPFANAIDSLCRVTDDFDGNGEVKVNLMDYYVLTSEEIAAMEAEGRGDEINHSRIMDNYQSLGQAMLTGDCCVVLFSRAVYEDFYGRYDDGAMFCDLTAYIPTDNLSKYEFYGDGNKAVLLSSLRLGSLPELEKLPEDTVLCLRCPNDSSSLGIGNGDEVFRRSEAVIRKIFELD